MNDEQRVPNKPDPLYPLGVEPAYLSPADRQNNELIAKFKSVKGPMWACKVCKTEVNRSNSNPEVCVDCYSKNAQNSAMAKKTNANWMEDAKELGLELFERQPEETDTEWRIWTTYRSYYPARLPTWNELATRCGSGVSTVVKAGQKWSFRVRLIRWAQFTDDDIQEKRIAAIKDMNEKQLKMSVTLQDKLSAAIELLDPTLLKPMELVNMFKMTTELERRITTYIPDKVESTAVDTKTASQGVTKLEDMSEILGILEKTGMLQGRTVGIETTTRIITKEE